MTQPAHVPRHYAKPPPEKEPLPHIPWYKDERLKLTHLTTASALRLMITAVVIFALVVTIGGFYLIDLATQQSQIIKSGRADRVRFQQSIQAEANQSKKDIQDLACILVEGIPDSKDPRVAPFRAKYHCPPYVPPKPKTKAATSAPTGAGPAPSNSVPSPAASSVPAPSPVSSPSALAKGGGAGQTPSQSPGGSTPTPTPSPTSVLHGVCKLVRLSC